MDVIARFDRGPGEEVRVAIVTRHGQTWLEFRVHRMSPADEGGAEGFSLPTALLGELDRAIQAAREALRQPEAPPRREGGAPAAPAAPRAGMPIVGRWGGQQGRIDARLPLACAVEYAIRGRASGGETPQRRGGRTTDISQTGLGLLLPERISILNVLRVDLRLPQGVLSLLGEVVWAQSSRAADAAAEGFRHGLRFTEVGPEERRRLDHLLADLGG